MRNHKFLKEKKDVLFFAGLYFAMIARYFMRGVQYFTYTDDNNQYGVYFRRALEGDIWNDIILYYRRFFERPLAFFSDAYIFQNFFEHMHILLILITTMYFLICLLLYKTFEKLQVGVGKVFVVFLALVPCAYEGAYWISASSRIVVSMFFGVLSVWLYFGGVKKIGRRVLIGLSFAMNLISYLYYEQTALFSFALFFLCAAISAWRQRESIKAFLVPMIIPVANMALTGGYYLYFMFFSSEGVSESRNKFVSENLVEKIIATTGELFNLTKETLISFNLSAIRNALSEPVGIGIAVALFLLTLFMASTVLSENHAEKEDRRGLLIKFAVGVLLAFAPLSIFYLLQNVYYEPRMLFPSFVGFAVLLDLFFDCVAVLCDPLKIAKRVFAAAMIIPFFLATVSIISVYQSTNATDKMIAENFLSAYAQNHTARTEKIYLLNTVSSYTGHETPPLANITAADWIMLGNLNASQRDYYFRNLVLVREQGDFDAALFDDPSVLVLGIDGDQTVFPLTRDSENTLYEPDGDVFGTAIWGVFKKR